MENQTTTNNGILVTPHASEGESLQEDEATRERRAREQWNRECLQWAREHNEVDPGE